MLEEVESYQLENSPIDITQCGEDYLIIQYHLLDVIRGGQKFQQLTYEEKADTLQSISDRSCILGTREGKVKILYRDDEMNWKEVKELFFGKDEAIHHFKCCDNTIYMSQKETSQLTVMKIDENSRRIPEDPKKITLPSERKVANLDIKGDLLALCFTKQKIGMHHNVLMLMA